MSKFMINNRTSAVKIDINLFFTTKIVRSRSLTHRINYSHVSVRLLSIKISQWARENFCSQRKKGHSRVPLCLQLFRLRLSYKRGKAYATMPKVIMGNGGFYGCLSELQCVSAWWKGTAQTRIRFFPVPCCWIALKLNQAKPSSYYP